MQTINLNQNSFRLFPTIYMVQNDTGRELKMILDDVTLAGTETGAVAIKRSDGSYYTIAATIDATNNAFDADMTQALTQPSRTECQLKVTASDDTVISTYTFIIMVQPSTDGLSEEQLGINPQDLIDAAAQLTLSDNDVKLALLQIAEKVVYTDEHGQDYYDALEDALYPQIRATSVSLNKNSLVFSDVGGTDTLVATVSPNNVEDDTVYWGSSDKDVAVVSDGIVLATGVGSATITAICGTVHSSASVVVAQVILLSISAVYTQSGAVYESTNLDDLKADLVVTASWDDSSVTTLADSDYSLSGTLAEGTSTITVNFGNKTDAFDVVVSANPRYTYYDYIYNTRTGTTEYADYVDTGLTFDPAVVAYNIEFEAMNSNTHTSAVKLMGQGGSFTNNNGHMVWYARASKAGFSTYTFKQAKQIATSGTEDTRCVIKYVYGGSSASYIEYNNTQTTVATVTKANIPSNANSFILCGGYNSNATTKGGMLKNVKLGYVKITDPDNNNLLYHFKPAYDSETEKYGYYEAVNNVFYPANTTYLRCGNWS